MKEWQSPNTTRTYLHPPKSERIITLWREGKLMLGLLRLAEAAETYGDPRSAEILADRLGQGK